MSRFAGQRVFVTGASRGMGRAVAVAFAREGATIGIGFRSRSTDASQTLAEVQAAGGTGVLAPFDVRSADAVDAAIASFGEGGGIDVLVNNAATLRDGLLPLLAADEWGDVIAVNLTGVYHCSRAALPFMLRRKGGAIINVASVAGLRASPGQTSYAASKGGVLALTITMAAELAPRGVRVNAVVPGVLTTGMGQRLDHRVAAQRRTAIPLGRFGEADEVARAILFLASADASYIVGQSLVVDGGLSL